MMLRAIARAASTLSRDAHAPQTPKPPAAVAVVQTMGYMLVQKDGSETYGMHSPDGAPYETEEEAEYHALSQKCDYAKVGAVEGTKEYIILKLFPGYNRDLDCNGGCSLSPKGRRNGSS